MRVSRLVLVVILLLFIPVVLFASAPAEADHGGAHGKTYFGIPADVLKVVNLVLFFGVLFYLLKGPVGKMFVDRKAQIQSQLTEAETRRQKAETLAADIDARLQLMQAEVAQIQAKATEDGERQKQELIAASHADAEKIRVTASSEIDARLKQAKAELTAFAGELATAQAQRILQSSVTDADRQKIFADTVRQIAEKKS